jgi:L-2-hydroxyglutarate oxidase LhgO
MADTIAARCVVNAAGLACDRVARLAGIDAAAAGYGLHLFKGEYFSLRKSLPIRPLIYPVPAAHGLGIHLTIDRQGRHRLGPNAFPVEALDYDVDSSHRQAFFEAASRYLKDLKIEDLVPGTAGIRPKLSADGSFRDFTISEESGRGLPGWVNLIGIESPGLTSSPVIADFVANLLEWQA